MNPLERDLQLSLRAAGLSLDAMQNALQVYQLHCQAHRWEEAETERMRMLASAESFLDSYAATHRRLELAGR